MAMSTPVDLISPVTGTSCHDEAIYVIFACGRLGATTSEVSMASGDGFAAALRRWRQRRGFSQLDLAGRAEISQRHLSFLELGRAMPSRDMVARLAAALDIPLRQQNALVLAA